MRVLVLLLLLLPRPASPCAVARPEGAQVAIAAEEALILWDAATKTETFIRRSAFRSSTETFGFLVPTPTLPAITEASDSLFQTLTSVITPEVRYVAEKKLVPSGIFCVTLGKGGDKKSAAVTSSAVRELQSVHVAGFEAITVEADDPNALTGWLAKHSFAATPELTAWLASYVEKKWKLTAFVFRGEGGTEVSTKAISLAFPTQRPFYPYREPAGGEADPHRLLRVFFASGERYGATIGDKPWRAKVAFSSIVSVPELGAQQRLTVFEDEGTREGTDEVYFDRSADQAVVKPPVQVLTYEDEVPIPVDVILVVVVIVVWMVVRRRKKRASVKQ